MHHPIVSQKLVSFEGVGFRMYSALCNGDGFLLPNTEISVLRLILLKPLSSTNYLHFFLSDQKLQSQSLNL